MSDFKPFKLAVQAQFEKMKEYDLFVTDISKDDIWDTYLNSFAEGTNPIFRERTTHDCQCCKQFMRTGGNVVAIINNKLVSIWDVEVGGIYQVVADELSKAVKTKPIVDAFLHYEKNVGTDYNIEMKDDNPTIRWEHFHYEVPVKCKKPKENIPSELGTIRTTKEVFKRGLDEITEESLDIVLELIEQKSLERGEGNKSNLLLFKKVSAEYKGLSDQDKEFYAWLQSKKLGMQARLRNSSIGTLLIDISSGMELSQAVFLYNQKVDPINYKRPTSLFTKSMVENARKTFSELGFEGAEKRRHAKVDDLTINNVLFADNSSKLSMNESMFDKVAKSVSAKPKSFDKIEEVSIEIFLKDILPKAEKIEVLFENKHTPNLMSLIAPEHKELPNMLQWDNNFSWSYKGEVADSIKENVKKAGGNITGIFRYSIQWNMNNDNQNDFDAHCREPNGNLIYFGKAGRIQPSSGILDVDIINPKDRIAVENIVYTDFKKMEKGTKELPYRLYVHNYTHRGGKSGFEAEIEYNNTIYSYTYNMELKQNQKVLVASCYFDENNNLVFVESLDNTASNKEEWGITTNNFHNVSMIMNSPNYWDRQTKGNKHLFFMIDGCLNPDSPRGFYNEFLDSRLTPHRKVFEMLGSEMKVQYSDNQLSGLGFSSAKRNQLICKITGSFSRTIKINF